ncbi:MAG: right-handed parallel beta-helix repeat-containing protein [Clostridia bacterium]|nr:right-handed parallel beta-helix repeat-containing protein [Clostridia bacterium]
MKNVFDITTYGAVGDGVTDSTAAIQAALDDAEKCRGVVTVPPGKYLTGKLRMGNGVILEGYAGWSFRSDGASTFILRDGETDCMIDITGAFGCAIRGLCMNGRRLGKNVHGVKLYWPVYNGGSEEDTPTIDECRIGSFSGDGVRLEHIWCFSVRHSMLCHNGGAGLYVDGWDGFLIDNWFSGNAAGGLVGGPCAASITATGNRVEWNRRAGFYLPHCNCCNFTGNYFDRSGGPGLYLGAKDGEALAISATGNIIYRSGKPVEGGFEEEWDNSHVRIIKGENVVFTGNTFRLGRDDGGKGVWSPDYVACIEDSVATIFENNVWQGGSLKDGVLLMGENDRVSVKNNIGMATPKE